MRKPNGYWGDWKNIESELDTVIGELGHFPTSLELLHMKKGTISVAATKYHGGLNLIRKKMGYTTLQKEKKYWMDFNNLKGELENVIENLGHFPTQRELSDIGRTDIGNGIGKYHGGINNVKKIMGYEITKKVSGFWDKWENVERELRGVIKKIGEFPTLEKLSELRVSSLGNAICRKHGGIDSVRKKLGYEIKTLPDGYWKDWSNVKRELKKLIRDMGRFPSEIDMRKAGKSSLGGSIVQYHGGIRKVRQRMGYENKLKPNGYWKDWNNFEREFGEIIEDLECFPKQRELIVLGKSDLVNGIRHHGGLLKVRERMGLGENSGKELEIFLDKYVEGGKSD